MTWMEVPLQLEHKNLLLLELKLVHVKYGSKVRVHDNHKTKQKRKNIR